MGGVRISGTRNFPDGRYPVFLDGELFSKEALLLEAAQLLPHIPDVAKTWVGDTGFNAIWKMCKLAGIDPQLFE